MMDTLEYMLGRAAELGVTDLPPYKMPACKWKVFAVGLNVRSGPGATYPVIRAEMFGNEVFILSEANGWAEIRPGEWVNKSYLRKVIG
jgi:hypothetical protein